MLVEDDKSLREIYSIRLAAEGYDIVSAGDGEEGLAVAVREKPDLIIADVMMPKISGFDMLDILRSQPETSKIKAIVMTALSSEDQRQRGESLGASKYLVKSQVGIEDVIDAVHEVLGDAPNSNAHANIGTAKAVGEAERKTAEAAPAQSAPAQAAPAPNPAAADPMSAPNPAVNPTTAANPAVNPTPTASPTANPTPTPENFNPAPVAQNTGSTTAVAQPAAGAIADANVLAQDTAHLQKQGIAPDTERVLQQANIQESVRQMYEQLRQQQLQKQMKAATPAPAPAPAPAIPPTPAPAVAPQPIVAAPAGASAVPPAPVPPKTVASNGAGMTSRIIAPIHDAAADARDAEMQQKMAEILGGDDSAKPSAVNSGNIATPEQEMQAVEKTAPIPPPPAPPVASDATNKGMPLPPNEPAPSPAPVTPPAAPAPSPAPEKASTPAPSQEPVQNPAAPDSTAAKPVEAITADTPIPSIDEIADPGINETVKPAQPGYLTNLAEELADDAASDEKLDPNSVAAQMKAELGGDAPAGVPDAA